MPSFKPKILKKIKHDTKTNYLLDVKHNEFIHEFNKNDTDKKDDAAKPKIRKTTKPKIVLDKYSPMDDTDLPKNEETVKNETTVIPKVDTPVVPPSPITFGKTITIKKIKK